METAKPAVKTITLPSGKTATIREAVGLDLMHAQRAVPAGNNEMAAVMFALVAETVEIDGKQIVYEDMLTMKLADVLALQREVMGENFASPPPSTSPPLSNSGSGPLN